MGLYQKSVANKYLKREDAQILLVGWQNFSKHFLNPAIQTNIWKSKEESYQEGFLDDLFVKILGYTKSPMPDFNLVVERKNQDNAKKADGAIVIDGKVVAVIELKDNRTANLKDVEEQAFGYKHHHPDCQYVITSNFRRLRLYIDNATAYEEFDLFSLTRESFELLYLSLAYENIRNGVPRKIKSESVVNEIDITSELYRDYSAFKNELRENLVAENPAEDRATLYQKSQKLLDRILFILFAEDCGLLQPNLVANVIIKDWKWLKRKNAYQTLYERFKLHFSYLDTGRASEENDGAEVFAYNGGLFAPDEVLDRVKISDDVLKRHATRLAEYNFASEVDVNILGHIFENSLNDQSRKKDGIFYTPKYVTKYIVENTLGKLCEEKKIALALNDDSNITVHTTSRHSRVLGGNLDNTPQADAPATFAQANHTASALAPRRVRGGDEVNREQLSKKQKSVELAKIDAYRDWLLLLTICDPACGSGAFLNAALAFLIDEHKHLDKLATRISGDTIITTNIENNVLEKNIFGVDINEDAVEIAKLSLWLRTAHPRRKLNDLADNIKCGNSLIDDPKIAGDKAFCWEKEFPQVFANGGFDVVIGNPPYVSNRAINEVDKTSYKKNYQSAIEQYDLYVLFIEKSVTLLRNSGYISLITPDKFLISQYGVGVLGYLSQTVEIVAFWDLTNTKVFPDASVYPVISVFNKNDNIKNAATLTKADFIAKSTEKEPHDNGEILVLKIEGVDRVKLNVWRPLATSKNVIDGNGLVVSNGEINRYSASPVSQKTSNGSRDGDAVPQKIILKKLCYNIEAFYDEVGLIPINTTYCIQSDDADLKYILTILNSRLLTFYAREKYINTSLRGGYIELRVFQLEQLPIKKISGHLQQPFIALADKMLSLASAFQSRKQKFLKRVSDNFAGVKINRVLGGFADLDFAAFVAELKKQKLPIPLKSQSEWDDFFTTAARDCRTLSTTIKQTDAEVDRLVYDLYGLSEEEIRIVKGK